MAKVFRPLLTTSDNPYNPFTEWDAWLTFDMQSGYNTCQLLSRCIDSVNAIDDGSNLAGMQEIVKHNLSGKHLMVTEETFDALISIED